MPDLLSHNREKALRESWPQHGSYFREMLRKAIFKPKSPFAIFIGLQIASVWCRYLGKRIAKHILTFGV